MHAGEQLVREQPDSVKIHAVIGGRIGGELLGRHVCRCADRDPYRRRSGMRHRRRECLRDAKVGDERMRTVMKNVSRLDVPMHDPSPVCIGESVEHVMQHSRHRARRKLAGVHERIAERHAFYERHRVPEQIAMLARVKHRHDVWMLKLRDEHDLPAESLAIDTCTELRLQYLHDHGSAEGVLDGDEHATHSPAGQLTLNRVRGREGALELVAKRVDFHRCQDAGRTKLRRGTAHR